jgi:hypothetical protein
MSALRRPVAQRGHVILLLMTAIAAFVFAAALFAGRLSMDIEGRHDEDVRVQCLWLARSALDVGIAGAHTVATPHGEAAVRVSGSGDAATAVVELAGARAEVGGQPRVERFTPDDLPRRAR